MQGAGCHYHRPTPHHSRGPPWAGRPRPTHCQQELRPGGTSGPFRGAVGVSMRTYERCESHEPPPRRGRNPSGGSSLSAHWRSGAPLYEGTGRLTWCPLSALHRSCPGRQSLAGGGRLPVFAPPCVNARARALLPVRPHCCNETRTQGYTKDSKQAISEAPVTQLALDPQGLGPQRQPERSNTP